MCVMTKKTKHLESPFSMGTPSVFVISSPFQALCAMAAIAQLQISDYKMLAFVSSKDLRRKQIQRVFDDSCISFEFVDFFNRERWHACLFDAIKNKRTPYKRLFVGDFRDIRQLVLGVGYISDGGDVVYLDDGNITVSLLKDIITEPMTGVYRWTIRLISWKRQLLFLNNLLTIYGDIPNSKYEILELNLDLAIKTKREEEERKGIYIVGTYIDRYCEQLGIDKTVFIDSLNSIMDNCLKEYPNDNMIYIPHGRDKSDYANDICKKHCCSFMPTDTMIELFLLQQNSPPKVVIGFTSSALFNIKKLFPKTIVVNYLLLNATNKEVCQEFKTLSEYYTLNGIEQKEISL